MDDKQLLVLLKEHFPTRVEFADLQQEMRQGFSEMRKEFVKINDSLDELTDSAHALDAVLEQYPIERIERLETHVELSPFVATTIEE